MATSVPASEIVQILGDLAGEEREKAILTFADSGAFPEALVNFVRVTTSRQDAQGRERTIAYDVTFDFFSLGTDADYIRMPMWPVTARRILDWWNCILPTPRMVEQIHKQATPIVMPTTSTARGSTEAYASTNARINAAVAKAKVPVGGLISGHRKDVVISKGLAAHPGNVVIYGGLKDDGTWWQTKSNPVSHNNRYVDYSHGFRFVRWDMWVDGAVHDIRDVLRDALLAPLLSADGPLSMLSYPLLPANVQ